MCYDRRKQHLLGVAGKSPKEIAEALDGKGRRGGILDGEKAYDVCKGSWQGSGSR